MSETITERFSRHRAELSRLGQEHVLRFWPELSDEQRSALLGDLDRLAYAALRDLIEGYVLRHSSSALPSSIEPAAFFPADPGVDLAERYADAVEHGGSLIRQNKVAAFTVAGGQGTRLGFDGPKGAFRISPVKNKPLFQLFAELIRGTNRRYGSRVPWYVMTSPANDAATRVFFAEHDYFCLPADDVIFFTQGVVPAFGRDGRLLLGQKHRLALAPDGHGGSLLALKRSGALADMARRGVEHISYFQVDNPLVRPIDPLFIGLHEMTGSQFSGKTIPKADDLERVGNFVVGDGKLMVIEYSDFPEELAHKRADDGRRMFDAGNIAIHVLTREVVERLTADEARFALPWHRAEKKVPFVDEAGRRIEPDEPNAIKLEAFVFDAIPLAEKTMILQTSRGEEFSPVKNATGVDSVETARRDMIRRAAAWLEKCGCHVPRRPDGEPDATIEISPLLALDAAHLREALGAPPAIQRGATVYLE